MNMIDFLSIYLRIFQGAPLSCLIAMLICEEPVSLDWLNKVTGYQSSELVFALRLLNRFGLIAKKPGNLYFLTVELAPDNADSTSSIINLN